MAPTRLLIDLFCGAGGAAKGFSRAGFRIIGVDIEPQPNYPCEFIQADALTFPLDGCDAVAASPPCQAHTRVASLGRARNRGKYPKHPDLIGPTRTLLEASGLPWVIENVVGAPLVDPIFLCGCMFPNLRVYRKRLFEANFEIEQPPHGKHNDSTPSAGHGVSPKGYISVCGSGGVRGMKAKQITSYWSYAMDIDWMVRAELAQAVPPPFTEWIGQRLQKEIDARAH